jgi:NADP-dependent aldehyde dehydrogenase
MGQFCTKPGLLLAPAGHDAAAEVGRALRFAAPTGHLLTAGIAASAIRGLDALVDAGAQVVDTVGAPAEGWAAQTVVLRTPLSALRAGSRLTEECFGPVALVAEYETMSELAAVVDQLQGALAGSVMTGGEGDPDVAASVGLLAPKVGRVAVNDWPTGVAFTWAQHHGGPWPSTSVPSATSVGAAALDRFVRPVTYQSVPDPGLPPALRSDNPWSLPRRVNGALEPATEGR